MEVFEPIVNLLVLMTMLSVACERITNLFKLDKEKKTAEQKLKDASEGKKKTLTPEEEKLDAVAKKAGSDYVISWYSIFCGVSLALLAKANFFEFITNLQDPWATLGWFRLEDYAWVRSPASRETGRVLYTVAGCLITGIGLGFGNKFWHDLLETVYQVKKIAQEKPATMKATASQTPPPNGNP